METTDDVSRTAEDLREEAHLRHCAPNVEQGLGLCVADDTLGER